MQALPPLLPFVMIALVRGFDESPIPAYSPVVLLPVFWFALYGTRLQLLISVICVGITYAVPSPALSGAGYPATEAIAALLWMVIAGIAGFTLSELVRQRELLAARLELTAAHRRAHRPAEPPRLGRGARSGDSARGPHRDARSASRCSTSTSSSSSTT